MRDGCRMGVRWLLSLLCAAAASPAHAATVTAAEQPGEQHWSAAACWAGPAPQDGDDIVLPAKADLVRDGDGHEVFTGLTCLGDARVGGTAIALSRVLHICTGTAQFTGTLILAGDCVLEIDASGVCDLDGRVLLAGHRLTVSGNGCLRVRGQVSDDGGIAVAGPGRVELSGLQDFRGGVVASGGELWLEGAVAPGKPSPIGLGELRVDGGTLVVDADGVSAPIHVGAGGGRIDAHGAERTLSGGLILTGLAGGGLIGTYCSLSLRSVLVDDWRRHAEAHGSRRDPQVLFPGGAFGTESERAAFGIGGDAGTWTEFSVQWDGYIRIERDGTRLYTCSDDGSRVRIGGPAAVGLPAQGGHGDGWVSNGWGSGHGAMVAEVHGPLSAGVYPIRIQYEQGQGGCCMGLLWDDAAHAQGSLGGMGAVPAADLLQCAQIELGGEDYGEGRGQPLVISGPVLGGGRLIKAGSSHVTISGRCEPLQSVRVEGGTLAFDTPLDASSGAACALEIGEHGTCVCAGGGTLGDVSGRGALEIPRNELALQGEGPVHFEGTVCGAGTLVKRGAGTAAIDGALGVQVRAESGMLVSGAGRIFAGVRLASPLNTFLELPLDVRGARHVHGTITLPANAPSGIGWAITAGDLHGDWCQRPGATALRAGVNRIDAGLADGDLLRAEPAGMAWESLSGAASRTALSLWSDHRCAGTVSVDLQVDGVGGDGPAARLEDLRTPTAVRSGERAEWRFLPTPFPHNPYDPAEFSAEAVVTAPDGSTRTINAFFWQGMSSRDGGDREIVRPTGEEAFALRLRPGQPGTWRVRLLCRWARGDRVEVELPPLEATGDAWDQYVRVDAQDHRFLSAGGAMVWPIGLNIRSVFDLRDRDCIATAVTPDRGTLAYDAYLARLAACGGTAAEIWMAPWNLGLEWRGDWNGFYGVGRYNQLNAWRLDQLLDRAEALGMHINLVIRNHGQASEGADHEWENSPYNRLHGGRLTRAHEYFTSPWALAHQQDYARYIVARYGDSPAVLGWKLWSEVNLTQAEGEVVEWHKRAAEAWHALDPYHHPVTTHWAGSWHDVNTNVAQLKGLDYLCIDAYHSGGLLAQLIFEGASSGGLGRFQKPILVTECGGNWNACPPDEMRAEQAQADWAALVSGNAGGGMLWWFEFVDQHGLWAPYTAISRYLAGEDLRGEDAASAELDVTSPAAALWCRGWVRPGRVLGYCLDSAWGGHGGAAATIGGATIDLGQRPAGNYHIEWWNADSGERMDGHGMSHPGGDMVLAIPPFARHIAFKFARDLN